MELFDAVHATMRFIWPNALWLLLATPAMVGAYFSLLRRRTAALRYPSTSLILPALSVDYPRRRHVPPALFLFAVVLAIVAVARPSARIALPFQRTTIILALDVSASMAADDVAPSRLAAAQSAAEAFVHDRPPTVRIGVVEFSAAATLVQPPTDDQDALDKAIRDFQPQGSTATGSALYVALAALLPDAGIDVESLTLGNRRSRQAPTAPACRRCPAEKSQLTTVPAGSYTAGAIVLMSDGRRTAGPDPLDAANMAAERGVRVFTVGFGTTTGGVVRLQDRSVWVTLDDETLKVVADITHGAYFHAGSAAELEKVYRDLGTRLAVEKKDTEISALFAAAAALLLAASAALSLLWFGRIA